MASGYGGTTDKCKACDKTVYVMDQLTIENQFYHKACFRCHHCKSTLKLSNYSSLDGVLYCKPHYDQLFMLTGSLDKSFEGAPKPEKAERSDGGENSRFSSVFVGTQDKCVVCSKTVYPLEKIGIDGNAYHKACFKCSHGGCKITTANYVLHDGKLYCEPHNVQLFLAKGSFQYEDAKSTTENPSSDEVAQEQTSNGDVTAASAES
ncbi:GATA type zinc finger transcription factor family protein [Rhynchospora pubera]|uniref:GATA type zinc finger transcription factor family protein n=1 Tax=Rhynchospora pubera TaxID=906938 RepID=A0AAV8H8L0_9POAL|nr:GATA type zinc finger transcription factor family protein [Rhynchospora pubera]